MRLFIAEKPSLAAEIAKVLGNPKKRQGFFETDGGVVTWCYGHILRTYEPDEYDPKYGRWNLHDLPIVPKEWKLKVVDKCKEQAKVIEGLLKKASEVVNGGDPDREGTLLVNECLEYFSYKGKVLRILINATDEKSICDALANMRDNTEFKPLSDAALARQRADWLLGMNATRAYTLYAQRAGYSGTQNVGRVKTPTLALVVRREQEIQDFKSVDYAIIRGVFEKNIKFAANWKASDEQEGLDSEGRLVNKDVLEKLLTKFAKCQDKAVVSFSQTSPKSESAPLPFSLSALQIAAGKAFGYSPAKVLEVAQKLYESKLTTYPRSDCDYLPESQFLDANAILENLGQFDETFDVWVNSANSGFKSRAWNDKKITAHHAIIPTTVKTNKNNLSKAEQDIYFLIARAYVAQFYPLFKYDKTNVELLFAGEKFAASGSIVIQEGYRVLYKAASKKSVDDGDNDEDENGLGVTEDNILPKLWKDEKIDFLNPEAKWKKTEPPKRFTQGSLIQAMKDIHKYCIDIEKKQRLKSTKGIGTEATRSTIIEELIEKGFMKVVGKNLIPTEAAFRIIAALPSCLTYPDETAEWEGALARIEERDPNVTLKTFTEGFAKRLPKLLSFDLKEGNLKAKWPCECGTGAYVKFPSKFNMGEFYFMCGECKTIREDDNGKPGEKRERKSTKDTEHTCPECGKGFMSRYKSKYKEGEFYYRCNECKEVRPEINNKPGEKKVFSGAQSGDKKYPCSCKKGYLIFHEAKNGKKAWWGCSNWRNGCKETRFDVKGKPSKK